MLYAASGRQAAYLETLQAYRPALADLALIEHAATGADISLLDDSLGRIPADYFTGKRIAAFRVRGGLPFLDLRSVETHAALRTRLAAELLAAGYSGVFNFGEIIGSDSRVTQQIARWSFDAGYGGIVYPSAHDQTLTCWAIFENAEIIPIGSPAVIRLNDPDLITAAQLFGLIIPD